MHVLAKVAPLQLLSSTMHSQLQGIYTKLLILCVGSQLSVVGCLDPVLLSH